MSSPDLAVLSSSQFKNLRLQKPLVETGKVRKEEGFRYGITNLIAYSNNHILQVAITALQEQSDIFACKMRRI